MALLTEGKMSKDELCDRQILGFCHFKHETVSYVLCDCVALVRMRNRLFEQGFTNLGDLRHRFLRKTLHFVGRLTEDI